MEASKTTESEFLYTSADLDVVGQTIDWKEWIYLEQFVD
jgi:hypothetical protein